MADKDNLFLSSYWQDLNTDVNIEGVTARRKADGYRKMLLLLGKLKSKCVNSFCRLIYYVPS